MYPAQEPMPANQHYDNYEPEQRRSGTRRWAVTIYTVADVAAGFLGLWILLYLLDANQANMFVGFVESVADLLAFWSQDIFTMDSEALRVLLNYGLPALLYLGIGHGIAIRMRSM
jgi:hypothetical protein